MPRRKLIVPWIAIMGGLISGCAIFGVYEPIVPIAGVIEKPEPTPVANEFRVGAARVDITPIPGIAMSYNLEGRVSRGFWTRLYARAIYVRGVNDAAIALVSCEVAAIPNGLRDRVAELVRAEPTLAHLGRAQLVISATHTHHGPQNYFSTQYYNSFPAARQGFDPELHEFLAQRIVQAIREAVKNETKGGQLAYRRSKAENLFRNRSFGAFVANPDADAYVASNAAISDTCSRVEGQSAAELCRAVRTWVEVVEFVDTNGALLASAAFLAAHPTVMGLDTEVYSGDVFGLAASMIERGEIPGCSSFAPPVMALFNGAEGDASFAWTEEKRDREEARELASWLARHICGDLPGKEAVPVTFETNPKVGFQFELALDLSARHADVNSSVPCEPWHEDCTAAKPVPGMASMGGAQDGRTFWFDVGLKERVRAAERGEHGRKATGIESRNSAYQIASVISDPDQALEEVSVGVYTIGRLAFATLPGEFTTMMGERIRTAVDAKLDALPGPVDHEVMLVGLANGRVSYVTTPEEYEEQYYEGAQNLFGAATGPRIESQLEDLAGKTGAVAQPTQSYLHDPGPCRVFLPSDIGAPAHSPEDGLDNVLLAPKRDRQTACWVDAIPKLSEVGGMCTRQVPYVWVETKTADPAQQCVGMFTTSVGQEILDLQCSASHPARCTGADPRHCIAGVPQDNCGADLLTVVHGTYPDRTRWCGFWLANQVGNFALCAAGVTDANLRQTPAWLSQTRGPLMRSASEPEPLDTGTQGFLLNLIERHQECSGTASRPVCEFPTPGP